jgi:hypothetical protein
LEACITAGGQLPFFHSEELKELRTCMGKRCVEWY